ncbi:GDSL-type esterase/lipase family protein [Kitasatospora viridis]|uniref:GDSL-like lipase/acylhydrolase family protein n=1 Tax=Kitasatospora viridis TaxID=281105 RepID=A0A561TSM1_9ACTN|nr:GDSL-type esterase/lipase family protein [Kitasatospora viridis]TWF90090.1 GDSL-like lipase/acylhydrolase family protein [Kitasatospora viridis]
MHQDTGFRARRLTAAALALPLAATGLLTVTAGPAQAAAPHSGTAITVSMGDSYISGEAGRWAGNSDTFTGSRNGTDRAYTGHGYDASQVYGATAQNGCDRSDSAEVLSAFGSGRAVNIACSGATTENVFRAADGGQSLKGEAPQADQLAAIAAHRRVGTVVLSIGGNDLGFVHDITQCVLDYEASAGDCRDSQQDAVDSQIDGAMDNVGKSIDEIRAVMKADGYASSAYRIVLQSYPSPFPRSSEDRYSQKGWNRTTKGGCPASNDDLDWARDQLVPQVAQRLSDVAADRGVQFLDVQDLLQGHEVCSTSDQLATSSQPPSAETSEWARFLTLGLTQGSKQESFHPNYYGQLALGRCLSLVAAEPADQSFSCQNTPGEGTDGVYLTPAS